LQQSPVQQVLQHVLQQVLQQSSPQLAALFAFGWLAWLIAIALKTTTNERTTKIRFI
jgi:hypothetical protein